MPKPDEKNRFVEIDKDQLDEEWLAQPRRLLKYAEKLADAKKAHAEAEAAVKVVAAELYLNISLNPEEYGLAKATVDTIKACVQIQPEHTAATQAEIEAKHAVDILAAAVSALNHRKTALEDLVTLHGQSYFARPVARGEGKEAVTLMEKKHARRPLRREADE